MRKTISIDFDGVIHLTDDPRYWVAPCHIAGRLNREALNFIHAALEAGWDIVIHSCRFYDANAAFAVREWLWRQIELERSPTFAEFIVSRLQCSLSKPRAKIYIDDRGFRYEGRFPRLEDIV